MNILNLYNSSLNSYPLLTKILTSFITFGSGDLICQKIENSKKFKNNYCLSRTLKQASFGIFIYPYLHTQYCILIPRIIKGKGLLLPIKNVAFDQIIGAPIFTCLFFIYLGLINSKKMMDIQQVIKKKLEPTLIMNWKIWPFLNFINFSIVPIPYRVLYSNITGMFWSIYLSSVNNSS